MTDPALAVASVLRHIARCRRKSVPVKPRQFGREARIDGEEDGVVYVTVATEGHAWRLRVFGAAERVRVVVAVDAESLEGER